MRSIRVTSQSAWISHARSASDSRVGRTTRRPVFIERVGIAVIIMASKKVAVANTSDPWMSATHPKIADAVLREG